MDITIFLAQMWGPVLLAIGLGFLFSGKYYLKIYRELDKQSFAVFTFALLAIAGGVAQIQAHNVWGTFPEVVISILGWGLLVKGIIFALAPRFVNRTAEAEAKMNLIPLAGTLMVMLGIYLSWLGLLA